MIHLITLRSKINWARSSIEYISWWGGGLISPTPAVEFLVTAISPMTLCPGSSPPSPGLAPLQQKQTKENQKRYIATG